MARVVSGSSWAIRSPLDLRRSKDLALAWRQPGGAAKAEDRIALVAGR